MSEINAYDCQWFAEIGGREALVEISELRNRAGSAEVGVCVWSPDDEYDTWHGSCGAELIFDESSPYENEFKFCPSCGRTLTQFAPDKSGRLEVEGVDPQI